MIEQGLMVEDPHKLKYRKTIQRCHGLRLTPKVHNLLYCGRHAVNGLVQYIVSLLDLPETAKWSLGTWVLIGQELCKNIFLVTRPEIANLFEASTPRRKFQFSDKSSFPSWLCQPWPNNSNSNSRIWWGIGFVKHGKPNVFAERYLLEKTIESLLTFVFSILSRASLEQITKVQPQPLESLIVLKPNGKSAFDWEKKESFFQRQIELFSLSKERTSRLAELPLLVRQNSRIFTVFRAWWEAIDALFQYL